MREVEERELTHLAGGRGVAGTGGGARRRRGWRHGRHFTFSSSELSSFAFVNCYD